MNATITPIDCPTGHYCPIGTEFDTQYPCPAGTYYNNTGNIIYNSMHSVYSMDNPVGIIYKVLV